MGLHNPSAAARWIRCPGSVMLCKDIPYTSSHYSREGNAAHELAAWCLTENRPAFDRYGQTIVVEDEKFVIDAEMCNAVQLYADKVYEKMAEVGCKAPIYVEQRYTIAEDINGYLDCWFVDQTCRKLYVIDYKHGAGVPVSVVNNEQLMIYALMLLTQDASGDEVTMVICQPRGRTSRPWQEWTASPDHLLTWYKDTVLPAKAASMEPDAPLVPGPVQCKWCPAKATCPALVDSALAPLGVSAASVQQAVPTLPSVKRLTPDELATLVARLQEADIVGWLDDAKEELKRVIQSGERPRTPDGKEYVLALGNRRYSWTDEGIMQARLGSLIDTQVHKTVTVAAARKALKELGNNAQQIEALLQGLVITKQGESLKLTDDPSISVRAPKLIPKKEKKANG